MRKLICLFLGHDWVNTQALHLPIYEYRTAAFFKSAKEKGIFHCKRCGTDRCKKGFF